MSPEHLHLMLNHLPIIGAGLALIPLVIGLLAHSKPSLLAGLAIAALCSWCSIIVMESGEEAYERYKSGPVTPYLDAQAYEALEVHEHRAEDWVKVLVVNAVVNSLCFVLVLLDKSYAEKVCWFSVVLGVISMASGIWIAESGGKIRRPDFRLDAVYMKDVDD